MRVEGSTDRAKPAGAYVDNFDASTPQLTELQADEMGEELSADTLNPVRAAAQKRKEEVM